MDCDWHTKYVPVNALGSRPGRRTRYHLRCKKNVCFEKFCTISLAAGDFIKIEKQRIRAQERQC